MFKWILVVVPFVYSFIAVGQKRVNLDQLIPKSGKYTYKEKPFTGVAVELNKEGKVIHSLEIKNGARDGKEKRWHSNGILSQLLTWDQSKYVHAFFYNEEGVKTKEVDYIRQLSNEWYSNGQMKYKDAHVKYPRSGEKPTHFWNQEGHLNWEGQKDEQGKLTGKWTYYYNSGEIRLIEHYLAGEKHGEESLWTEEGKPERILHYKKGVKSGEEQHYWANGQLKTSFNFENGVKHGIGKYYIEDGTLIRKMVFDSGELKEIEKIAGNYLFVMGKVTSSSSHCGGMYRPPVPPQPMGNYSFYIRKGTKNSTVEPVKVVRTNWEGELIFHVEPGDYCLASGRKIKEFNVLDYLTKEEIEAQKQPKKQIPASGLIKGTPECYQAWWERGDFVLKKDDDDITGFTINYHQKCFVGNDPCAVYTGPWPP